MRNIAKVNLMARATNLDLAKEWVQAVIENQWVQRIRCEDWLKPLNVRAIHDIQRQSRLEGMCDWIWANPGFIQWSTRPSPQASDRILCVYGPPGCGKSVLASSIEEGFRKKQFTTLFYSFSGIDAD